MQSAVSASKAAHQFKRQVSQRRSSNQAENAFDRSAELHDALLPQHSQREERNSTGPPQQPAEQVKPTCWYDLRHDARGLLHMLLNKMQLLQLAFPALAVLSVYAHSSESASAGARSLVFVCAFLAIIPSSTLLGDLTEQLSIWLGDRLGALCTATLGNLTEILVSLQALRRGEVLVVQASLVGSILSNMLLVLGLCFLCGGMKYQYQYFNVTAVMSMSSNLLLSALGITIPTLFSSFGNIRNDNRLSFAAATILLAEYIAYLCYSLFTHSNDGASETPSAEEHGAAESDMEHYAGDGNKSDSQEDETPCASALGLVLALACIALLLGWESDELVAGIEPVSHYMPRSFVSMILLPIVGNAAEHLTAVLVAVRDKMDLAISVALGSALQISLGVLPFLVIVSEFLFPEHPLTLIFPPTYTLSMVRDSLLIRLNHYAGASNHCISLCFICFVWRYFLFLSFDNAG